MEVKIIDTLTGGQGLLVEYEGQCYDIPIYIGGALGERYIEAEIKRAIERQVWYKTLFGKIVIIE